MMTNDTKKIEQGNCDITTIRESDIAFCDCLYLNDSIYGLHISYTSKANMLTPQSFVPCLSGPAAHKPGQPLGTRRPKAQERPQAQDGRPM